MLEGFEAFQKLRQSGNPGFGGLTGLPAKSPRMSVGLKAIALGLDAEKMYKLLWNKKTRQLALEETPEKSEGYKFTTTGKVTKTRVLQIKGFVEHFQIIGKFKFIKLEKIENVWVFDLEKKSEGG